MQLIFRNILIFSCVLWLKVNVSSPCYPYNADTESWYAWDKYTKIGKNHINYGENFEFNYGQHYEYGEWLKEYVKAEKKKKENVKYAHPQWELKSKKPELGMIEWPLWAMVEGTGKPSYCFDSPVRGPCQFNIPRWGFNSFRNDCETYTWSGCGGTNNRFLLRKNCLETCRDPIKAPCAHAVHKEDTLPYNRWP